jgi:hypothetical protein
MFTMTVPAGEAPKRGDLLHTNCGTPKERTWLILRARKMARRTDAPLGTVKPRFEVWRVRWWELEPEFRMKLYRSAERAGGQFIWKPEPLAFENLRRGKHAARSKKHMPQRARHSGTGEHLLDYAGDV